MRNRAATEAPLVGASVIVTRPVGQGHALRRRIAALGGSALSVPGSRLRAAPANAALRRQLRAAQRAARVIFASPAAVRFAFALLPGLRFSRATTVLAVGAATARALRAHGVVAVCPSERQDSEGLLVLPELQRLRDLTVALIGAPNGRELLPQALRRRGAVLESIEVYERQPPRLNRRHFDAIAAAASPCLLLLSSQQTLLNLAHLLPALTWAQLRHAEVIASSARIALAARAQGFASVTVARSAQPDALLTAAVGALARHRL